MYQYLMFDLDGTLLDTLEDLEASMNHVLKAYQYPIRTREEQTPRCQHPAGRRTKRCSGPAV